MVVKGKNNLIKINKISLHTCQYNSIPFSLKYGFQSLFGSISIP